MSRTSEACPAELLTDEFFGNLERRPIAECERLRSAELGIRWRDGASDSEHLASAVKHYERRTHVRNPAESLKGDEAVAPDHYQPLQPVTHTGQADGPALVGDSIVQDQMTSVNLNANAIAIQYEDARFADGRECGRVCEAAIGVIPPVVVRDCRLLLTVGRPV